MTNQQHPITPPLELRRLWAQQAQRMDPRDPVAWQEHVATQAARWGADQELKACCEWLDNTDVDDSQEAAKHLRAARRPKPPSLKEQALDILQYPKDFWSEDEVNTIRRALEKLDD